MCDGAVKVEGGISLLTGVNAVAEAVSWFMPSSKVYPEYLKNTICSNT